MSEDVLVNFDTVDGLPRLKPDPEPLKAVMKDWGIHVEDGIMYHKKEQDVSDHIKFMKELKDEISNNPLKDNLCIRRTICAPKVEVMKAQKALLEKHDLDPRTCDDQFYYYMAMKKYMREHPRMRHYVTDDKSTNRIVVA